MELDLQSSRTIVGFELSSLDNRVSSCELQWSVDGVSWITAGTLMTTNNAATIQFPDIYARLWKLINIQSGNSDWPAITEMQFLIGQSTSSPTPSPTPDPTPTSDPIISAVGDPHLVNVYGQRFDLYQPGVHPLIRIPRWVGRRTAFLMQAMATRIGDGCAELYFTQINITGMWARRHRAADLTWAAEDVGRGKAKWRKFHQISVKVLHGHTLLGTRYLNVLVRGLNKANFAIGGLLGEDDHAAAGTPSTGCRHLQSL